MKFTNYIFDLYGTLLDVSTNEAKGKLWRELAKIYNVYGCGWEARALYKRFFEMDAEERKKTGEWNGCETPEIRLEKVFLRLLFEPAEPSDLHPVDACIAERKLEEWREAYGREPDTVLDLLKDSDWVYFMANIFRTLSREYIRPYDNTIPLLEKLKKKKKKIFLLSNAQRIFTWPELEESGILPYFDAVYISSDHDRKKPDPLFLDILLKEQELKKEECVMVGNEIDADVRIALSRGMHSIYVNTHHLDKKEVKEKIEEEMKRSGADKKISPKVIQNGDIGKAV